MTAVELVAGNGVLVAVGVVAGVAIFAALVWSWLWGEYDELFGNPEAKHKGGKP